MYKIILPVILLLVFTGCESFLEVEEPGEATIPEFFSDMDGIRGALPGAYSAVYEYYDDGMMLYPDVAGDMVSLDAVAGDGYMVDQYNYTSDPELESTVIGRIWTGAYEALANVNNILEYQPGLVDKFPENEQELTRIKAEALFLRALIHFDLVRTYAQPFNYTDGAGHPGVPVLLRTPGPDDNPSRDSISAVYDQIIADLQESVTLFPEDNGQSKFHASELAAQALLARVYGYMQQWDDAAEYAGSVIDQTALSRGQEYIDMFRTLATGEEAIFRLNGNLKNSSISEFYNPNGGNGGVAEKLLSLYDDSTDIRLNLLQSDPGAGASVLKYYLPQLSEGDKQTDIFVLRASEMYLIRAEANVHLDNMAAAINDLKAIRSRALQKPSSEIDIDADTPEVLMEEIINERSKELSFEGHRLFTITRLKRDLNRGDNTTSIVETISYPDYRFILPIPQTEVDANKNLQQNDKY